MTSLLLPAPHWSPLHSLPLWNGPRKTSSKGPSAWQIKDAMESVSVIPPLLDPESSLSFWKKGRKKNEKSLRNLLCILLQNFSLKATVSPRLPFCKPVTFCRMGLVHHLWQSSPAPFGGTEANRRGTSKAQGRNVYTGG